MRKKGDWAKVTGGMYGAVYDGQRWLSFECEYCTMVDGITVPAQRLNLGDVHQGMNAAMRRRREHGWDHKCQGAKRHRLFFEMKAYSNFPWQVEER